MAWPFIWSNLNSHLRMFFANFCWNWPGDSGDGENVKSLQTDGQTNGSHVIKKKLTWAFSSIELENRGCSVYISIII